MSTGRSLAKSCACGLALACLLLVSAPARAQVATADIVGTVTDSSAGVVAGAKITITNLETGLAYNTLSNDRGEYVVPLLPAGRYKIAGEAQGFKTWNLPSVTLTIGERFRADMRLEVGAVDQSVTVTAEAIALQTDSATVSDVVTSRQVKDLPVSGRNFIVLAQMVAGANDVTTGTFANGGLDDRRRNTTISANGRTGAENNFLIDGMDNNQKFIGSILVKPSQDSVAEMRVYTNSFSAEFARTSGAAVSVITKGGTNEIHGSLFEYFRNQSLDARPPSLAYTAAKPPYHQHNVGGGMGGPIKKDRTFFFGNWEMYKVSLGQVMLSTVPTDAMRIGDFSAAGISTIYDPASTVPDPNNAGKYLRTPFPNNKIPSDRFNPIAAKIINFYPTAQSSGLVNNYQRSSSREQTDHTVDTRLDHRFNEKNNFFLRYSYDHIYSQQPQAFPQTKEGYYISGGGKGPQSIQGVAVNDTYTLSPRMVLVARAGYSRYSAIAFQQSVGQTPATDLGMPNINVDADSAGFPDFSMTNFTGVGDGTYMPSFNYENIFTGSGSVQYLHGTHSMKFGGDLTRRRVNETQSAQPRVAFAFTPAFTADPNATGTTGNAMASFLMGYPATTTRNKYLIHPGYRMWESGLYFQDDWRVNRWLTLNPGIRFDYAGPITERNGLAPNFDFTLKKLVFPGKDGVSGTGNVPGDWNNFSPRMGFAAQVNSKTVLRGGFGINYTPLLQGTNSAFRNPPFNNTLSILTDNIHTSNKLGDPIPPATANDPVNLTGGPIYAVSMGYKLPYVIQYNFTLQRQMPSGMVWTSSYAATLGRQQSGSNNIFEMDGAPPGPGDVQTRRTYSSLYPGLTGISYVTNAYTSSYHSWQNTVTMRERYGMVASLNWTWAHGIDNCGSAGGGRCQSQRYTGVGQFVLLKIDSSNDIRHRVAFTWNWDLPYGGRSRSLLSHFIRNWKLNALGYWMTSQPLTITQTGTQTNNATGGNYPNVVGDWHVSNPSRAQFFNAAAFQAQPNYQWGNLYPDFLRGPHRWNVDAGLGREFPIRERFRLQFRLESFNFTNSVMWSNPVTQLGAPGFGSILTVTGNRQSQVALKILY